jgi:DNA polymerase-4
MSRTIMHVDMNAFFAMVEQPSNPALRGRPVAVTGSEQRTVILTASYEARQFGIRTGMLRHEARARCPGLVLLPARNPLYTDVAAQIMALLHDYTPLVEVFSIDEAFLDLTGSLTLFGGAERIAYLIKSRLRARFGLTCSIGIAPNRLLAKLAAERVKPDGLTIFSAAQVPAMLDATPVGELCGIGPRLGKQLNDLGIFTCGQLGRYPEGRLVHRYGVLGARLQAMGRGLDPTPVLAAEASAPVKSIGHSLTLRKDLADRQALSRVLLQLAEMVGRRARRHGMSGRTVTLTIRYADFTTFSRQQQQPDDLAQGPAIYAAVLRILDGLTLEQPVRLLGISLSSLCRQGAQLPLFAGERRSRRLTEALDEVNDRFGEFTVMAASLLEQTQRECRVISPTWRPDGVRQVTVG